MAPLFINSLIMKPMNKIDFCSGRSIGVLPEAPGALRSQKRSLQMQVLEFCEEVCGMREQGTRMRICAILQTCSVDIWCLTNAPEMYPMLGHIMKTYALPGWLLEVAGFVMDVDQAPLLS